MKMPNNESNSSSDSNEATEENIGDGYQVSLIAGHNIWEWVFLLVSVWNIALLLASSGVALVQCDLNRTLLSPEFSTEIIVVILAVMALGFAVYGVHEEHQFDMYLHVIFVSLAGFFCYLAAHKNCHPCFKLICFYVSIGMSIASGFLVFKATSAADWTEFQIIGASESLATMYRKQCAFLSLLKLDALLVERYFIEKTGMVFFLGSSILCFLKIIFRAIFKIICAVYSFPITLEFPNKTNLYLLLTLIVMYSFMSWCCGKVTVCKEDKYLASGFVVLCITYPCLVIYQIYMSSHKNLVDNPIFQESARVLGILMIAGKLLLACLMVQTCKTFGFGLNTRSFLDLVSRHSNSLLAYSRSSLLF